MRKLSLILLVLLLAVVYANSQVSQTWVKQFGVGIAPSQAAHAIDVDQEGNVYVGGNSHLLKYSSYGGLLWQKEVISKFLSVGNGDNGLYSINMGGDWSTGYNYDLTKLETTTGAVQWQEAYDEIGWNEPKASVTDDNGNVYIVGFSGQRPDYQYVLLKFDVFGTLLWVTNFNETLWDEPSDVAIDNIGNVYITGKSQLQVDSFDYLTIKYDSAGNQKWIARYDGGTNNWNIATALAIDNAGDIYVTGYSGVFAGHLKSDITTIKYDSSSGSLLWVKSYDGPYSGTDWDADTPIGIGVGLSGVFVTGWIEGATGFDWVTLKYDTDNGDQQWVKIYNAAESISPVAMVIDPNDNIYVTGDIARPKSGFYSNYDMLTVKYDSYGNQVWITSYDKVGSSVDKPRAIKVVGENIYVTGYSLVDNVNSYYTTIKYTQVITNLSDEPNAQRLTDFILNQNYPNPFNPRTTISYQLPVASEVELIIYNSLGQQVAILISENQPAGQHQYQWDASIFSSGVYLYRLRAGGHVITKKMFLLK